MIEPWRHVTRLIWHSELPPRADWDAALRIARENGLLPLVAFLALGREASLPEDVINCLCEARRHAVAHQVVATHQIEQLAQIASGLNTRVILLKGPVVARTYPHPAARSFVDLDLLIISKSAAERFASALRDRGYTPHSESRTYQHLPPLRPPSSGLRVEVHYPSEKATDLLDEDVWQAARPMDSASGLWIMADVDHALYTIIHAVQKHALESGLRWLYDLTCLTRNWDETTWIELVMQARRRGIMPAVQLTGTLWAWAQEKPWGELPFGDLTEPPPAAIEAAAKAMTLKRCSSRLPTVWREVPGGGIAGWLRYGWIVLTQEGKIGVKDVPQRMIYLIRQHGPALGQLLHGDAEARSKWRNQHLLYEWLREKNNEQV